MVKKLLRFFLSRIWIRLLAFNVLLVFLPLAALWALEDFEKYLLDLQENSNIQQGRLLAAALGESGPLDTKEARSILRNLHQRVDARLRIVDADMNLVADSSLFGPRAGEDGAPPDPGSEAGGQAESQVKDSWLYRFGSWLFRLYDRALNRAPQPTSPEGEFYDGAEKMDGEEVRAALDGRYGRLTRFANAGTSLVMYSAIPIRSGDDVVGVALVSKSTGLVLERLYDLRHQTFKVVLISVAVAIILSLLVSTTIAQPVARLGKQARAILDRRGRLRGRFKPYRRLDEVGDLSRALHELTRRLEEHISFIETFAADVSHEFKNPLASIRNATELLAEVEDPEERRRFHGMVLKDIARLEKLLSGVREITQIDAQIGDEPTEPVRLDELLGTLVGNFELRRDGDVTYRLDLPASPVTVRAPPHRLAQVFENLLDNARSFSPAGGVVTVRLDTDDHKAVARVEDQGPGIPEEHVELIFSRFFSYRPEEAEDGHTGLGLAIVKSIVEGAGGRVAGRNAPSRGAVLEVELPLAG